MHKNGRLDLLLVTMEAVWPNLESCNTDTTKKMATEISLYAIQSSMYQVKTETNTIHTECMSLVVLTSKLRKYKWIDQVLHA